MRHLPTTAAEAAARGWSELDIILVTGDAYIDHPAFGVPLLGRWLEQHGFRVGIIAQPDWRSCEAFTVLGRPRLFFGVSAGAMDSMVAHYTPRKKLRHDDAYTPGGQHGARPNRASIIYTSKLKEAFRGVPVVLGGLEASLRRLAHYDYWDDRVRRSLLLDAKADLLLYGMGERSILELARRLDAGNAMTTIRDIPGMVYVCGSSDVPQDALEVPGYEQVVSDRDAYRRAFVAVEREQCHGAGHTIVQRHGERAVVCTPPSPPLDTEELDLCYALPYTREPYPGYQERIPAFDQIKTSITSHRGCFGGCSFCAITYHQGKLVQSRSLASVRDEVKVLTGKSWFRGSLSDVGGPTANMYRSHCGAPDQGAGCRRPSCLSPSRCPRLVVDDRHAAAMLEHVRTIPRVTHCAVASGIRHDLLTEQPAYYRQLISHHIGGLLKIAPEHLVDRVTALMRKPGQQVTREFLERFREDIRQMGRRYGVVPYLISGHPGCTVDDMLELAGALASLGLAAEQVQEFTPTPGTAATCMYYTGLDLKTGAPLHVARSDREKILQKAIMLCHIPEERTRAIRLLRDIGREELVARLPRPSGAGPRTPPKRKAR